MKMSIILGLILIAMAVEVRAVERGHTVVTATGGILCDGGNGGRWSLLAWNLPVFAR